MKQLFLIPVGLLLLAGCNSSQTSPPAASEPVAKATSSAPAKLTATEQLAKYCRVCTVEGSPHEEFLPSRLNMTVAGTTYKFCSEPCRKKFEANKNRYSLKS